MRIISRIKEKKVMILAVITMAYPAIIEMALNTLLGVSDTAMLGQFIGKDAISAVGTANQLVFAIIFIFSAFNTGAVALISRAFGEKNYQKIKRVAEQNVSLNVFIAFIIMTSTFIFRNQLFGLFKMDSEIMNIAIQYFNIILLSMIPMFLSFSFAAILRGSGDTKSPMKITAIANGLNIIGNFILITGVGPFPKMGVSGAALSTLLSRIIAVGLYVYILYIKESNTRLRFRFVFDRDVIKSLWNISLPGAVEQAFMQISFIVTGIFIYTLSTASESAFRVLIQIESISFMPAVGISIATATLVGKALGEKDIEKACETGYISSGLGVLWGAIMALIFFVFGRLILMIFLKDIDAINVGMTTMPFLAINQLGLNFMIVMSGALRGAGDTKSVMIYTVSRLWLIFVPLTYLFITKMNSGVPGLWYAEIISFIVFSMIILKRFNTKKWAVIK